VGVTVTQERPDHPDAAALIEELDAVLAPLYPDESRHGLSVERLVEQDVAFYVARVDGVPAACGGVLIVPGNSAAGDSPYGEVKRMYVRPGHRGAGLARTILATLAQHARDHGAAFLRLETGIHQVDAIRLYEAWGFRRRPPFGPYRDDPLSRCYEMPLE
jgi:putative acetyltransferase